MCVCVCVEGVGCGGGQGNSDKGLRGVSQMEEQFCEQLDCCICCSVFRAITPASLASLPWWTGKLDRRLLTICQISPPAADTVNIDKAIIKLGLVL